MTVLATLQAFQFLAMLGAADPQLGTNPAIPANMHVTPFVTGLTMPYGLVELPDGSILAATGIGPYSFGGYQIVRITQTNGVANAPTVVFTGGPNPPTGLTNVGNLVAVASGTNTGSEIVVMRAGVGGAMTEVGRLTFDYPIGFWNHDSHNLTMRAVPGQPDTYQLAFSVGSEMNDGPTTSGTVGISGMANAQLNANSIYSMTFSVNGTTPTVSVVTQLATGLRNPFALGFNSAGDLYFGENGIDLNGSNTPVSTDYFGIIANGTPNVLDFGFPNTYYDPQTGQMIGPGAGITQPFMKFLPQNGMSTQGVGGLAIAPIGFPTGLNNGVFFGFYGKHTDGLNNNLGGVVYVDITTGQYFDFIPNAQDGFDHPMSFLATGDALYFADLSTVGDEGIEGSGTIFRVAVTTAPEPGTLALFGLGVTALIAAKRRRRSKQ